MKKTNCNAEKREESFSEKKRYESPEIELVNFSQSCREEILLVSNQWDGEDNYDFSEGKWW